MSHYTGKTWINTYWLFLDQAVRMGVGFFTLLFVARALGPENFGILNYAIAFVSLFSVLTSLGIERIIIRELIEGTVDATELLSTSFYLKVFGSLLLVFIATSLSFFFDETGKSIPLLIFLFSLTSLLQTMDVVEYWYQSQMTSRIPVFAKMIPFLLASAGKVFIATYFKSVVILAIVYLAEAILIAFFLFYLRKHQQMFSISLVNISKAKKMLKESLPLIFSTIFVTIYLRIDQVFLQHMATPEIAGMYAASVRISEIPFIIGTLFANAALPVIIKNRKIEEKNFFIDLKFLFSIVIIVGVIISLLVSFFSEYIVLLIFGKQYLAAAPLLAIQIWSLTFVYLGVAQGIWIISEKFSSISLIATATGALVNVLLNFLLIPKFSAAGAAYATVIAYAVSGFLINFFIPRARIVAQLQIEAISPLFLLKQLKERRII